MDGNAAGPNAYDEMDSDRTRNPADPRHRHLPAAMVDRPVNALNGIRHGGAFAAVPDLTLRTAPLLHHFDTVARAGHAMRPGLVKIGDQHTKGHADADPQVKARFAVESEPAGDVESGN